MIQENGIGFPLSKADDYFTQIGEGGWSEFGDGVSDEGKQDRFDLGPANIENPLLKLLSSRLGVNGQGSALFVAVLTVLIILLMC